jgi:hypothetical protein
LNHLVRALEGRKGWRVTCSFGDSLSEWLKIMKKGANHAKVKVLSKDCIFHVVVFY